VAVIRISGWRLWGRGSAEAGAASSTFAGLMQRDRMLVSLGSAAVDFLGVLAGQVLIGGLQARLIGTAAKYSNPAARSPPGQPDQASPHRPDCWQSLLKPGPGTVFGDCDQEECTILAFRRVWPAAPGGFSSSRANTQILAGVPSTRTGCLSVSVSPAGPLGRGGGTSRTTRPPGRVTWAASRSAPDSQRFESVSMRNCFPNGRLETRASNDPLA
jgi:hypothetical protein